MSLSRRFSIPAVTCALAQRASGRRSSKLTVTASGLSQAAVEEPPAEPAPTSGTRPTEAAKAAVFRTTLAPEQDALVELEVIGSVPLWLKGSYVRNGVGHFEPVMQFLFDGFGMLARFQIMNGRVSSMQRYVDSATFRAFKETGELQYSEFGTHLGTVRNLLNFVAGRAGFGAGVTDNSAINVLPLTGGKEMLSLAEMCQGVYRVGVEALNTIERAQQGGNISGQVTTAHPAIYPDGTVYNLAVDIGKGRSVYKLDCDTLERIKIADVPTPEPLSPSWVHDFPFTENYIIIPDTPLKFNILGAILGNAQFCAFDWKPEKGTQLHIINRHTGNTRTVTCPDNYYAIHYMNAFETDGGKTLCIDTPAFKDCNVLISSTLDNMRVDTSNTMPSPLKRITVSLEEGNSSPVSIDTIQKDSTMSNELGRINPQCKGRDYQHLYHVGTVQPAAIGNALCKLNVKTGETEVWHEPGCIPMEPLFIPRPGGQEEDDGVALSIVAGADGRSFLLIMDGHTWQELARAQLPYGMAFMFHGQFLSS